MPRRGGRRFPCTLARPPPIVKLNRCPRRSCGINDLRIEREARLFRPRLSVRIGGRLVPLLRSGRSPANGSIPLLSTTPRQPVTFTL